MQIIARPPAVAGDRAGIDQRVDGGYQLGGGIVRARAPQLELLSD